MIYDIVVIGAGPAGSTAAFYIKNKKTLIIDKFSFPRFKACGGGLLNSKDWHLEFENYKKIENKLKKYPSKELVIYSNKKRLFTNKTNHLWDHINRKEFDNLLLKESLKKKNVNFKKFNVEKIEREKDYYVLVNKINKKIKTKKIIGADGWNSIVSNFLGNKRRTNKDYAMCIEYEIECKKKTKSNHAFYFFNKIYGYAWLFPTEQGYYVGLGTIKKTKKNLKVYLDEFLEYVARKNLIPKGYNIKNFFGAPDPLKKSKKFASESIILCGDALGVVKQPTGEGIYYALLSGKIAGLVMNDNFNIGENYKNQIEPVLKETNYIKRFPQKIFFLILSSLMVFLLKHSKRIRGKIANKFLRRENLPKDSWYRKFDGL